MAQDNLTRTVRILFAHTSSHFLPALSSALESVAEFSLEEYSGAPDDIWIKAISYSADVAVLYFPEVDESHERCVRRILRGCFSRILLLTGSAVSIDTGKDGDRVDTYLMPSSKHNFDDIVSTVRKISGKKRPSTPPPAIKPPERPSGRPAQESKTQLPPAGGPFAGKLVAVGASTGGTEALATFFRGLRPPMPGIVVVQHMPPVFTAMFAERLDRELPFDVVEAADNVPIRPNSIHIAPGDRHLKVKKISGVFYTVVAGTQKVGGHCPSVDVLFDSVADVVGPAASGVILTGMGGDGAQGLLKMRQNGAFTIGQDEASCVVYGMPRKAFELGGVVKQAPLGDIAAILMKHLGG